VAGTNTFKELRTEAGYGSARKLARRMECGPMAVLGWDQGAEPGAAHLILLAEVLGTSPAYVLRVIQNAQAKPKPKASTAA